MIYDVIVIADSGKHMLRVSDSKEVPSELVGAWQTMIGPVKDQTSMLHYCCWLLVMQWKFCKRLSD